MPLKSISRLLILYYCLFIVTLSCFLLFELPSTVLLSQHHLPGGYMEISIGINPNCSETVYQICGVTQEIADIIKEDFKEALKDKYKGDYLNSYAESLFTIETKYHLGLYEINGDSHIPDWDTLAKISSELGHPPHYVSCCSSPISTDEHMENHLEYLKEVKESINDNKESNAA